MTIIEVPPNLPPATTPVTIAIYTILTPPRHPQLIHLAYEKRGSGIVSQKPCCSVTFRSGRGCLWCLCQVRTLFAMADQCLSEYAWLMLRRYFLLPR